MSKIPALLCAIFCAFMCNGQTTEIKYYNKNYKEVSEDKARHKIVTTKYDDDIRTVESIDLKTGDKYMETYKGIAPWGVWKDEDGEMDYRFDVKYTTERCRNGDLLPDVKYYFEDSTTIGYQAPRISMKKKFFEYLGENFRYPKPAREQNIQGKLEAQFIITKEGEISDIQILKSAHPILDKDFVLQMKKVKFGVPAKINGQAVSICVSLPFTFRLE